LIHGSKCSKNFLSENFVVLIRAKNAGANAFRIKLQMPFILQSIDCTLRFILVLSLKNPKNWEKYYEVYEFTT